MIRISKLAWVGALSIAALALTGCNQGRRQVQDPGGIGVAGGTASRKLALIVPNPSDPWMALVQTYMRKAATERRGELNVLPIRSGTEEDVTKALGAAAALEARGVALMVPDEKAGIYVRDLTENYGMTTLAIGSRLMDKDTNKYLDLPYFGIENRDLGNFAVQYALDEMRKRQWTASNTRVVIFTMNSRTDLKQRADAMVDGIKAGGFSDGQIRQSPWTPGADAGAALVGNATHWIILGPADAPVIAATTAAASKGVSASNVIGISIGGLAAIDELKKPENGFFGTILISPKVHGYDVAMKLMDAVRAGGLETLPEFDNGIFTNRANLNQVIEEQMLGDLPATAKNVVP